MPNRLESVEQTIGAAIPVEETPQRQYVKELASRKIKGFLGTIDDDGNYLDNVYQSNRSLTANIASDYRDRFLIELIQNAYDTHPVGARDGQISITLDKRWGGNGTLFIANKGDAFAEKNVKGLCDIGLSQKPPGESIGNKGLGFRSVVQITNTPRIYSQCPVSPCENQFSGFCFRFAEPDDYSELIQNPRNLKLARQDLPIFHIPICLDTQSNSVCEFAEASFSTVIELPLRDADSRNSVQREINHLHDQKIPILLFLDRVSSLMIRTIDEAGKIETEIEFTRSVEVCPAIDMELSHVNLGDAGLFLVGRLDIPEATIKDAIATGINRKELSDHWEGWAGDGEVAVAVRLDSAVLSSRLYTFLPMGEQAAAPFLGYLHGSFAPSSNRKNLNARIQLNAVLLAEATALASKTIHHIITDPFGSMAERLTAQERAMAVVDLLCWTEVDSLKTCKKLAADLTQRLAHCFGVNSFNETPIVPCLLLESKKPNLTWQPPANVRRWPEETKMFAHDVAARFTPKINIWPIWRDLGPRIDPLEDFLREYAVDYAGVPCAKERAYLVQLVAKELGGSRRTPKHRWLDFFREIPDFMGCDGNYLSGRQVLLGYDGELHSAMSAIPPMESAHSPSRRRRRKIVTAVFSPPDPRRASTDADLEVHPPKKLSRRFGFLSTTLPWHGELSAARIYLEKHKLVEEFDREAVLAHLSRTLRGEKNKEVLKGGLRWAFQLWRQPRNHGRPFQLQPQHRFPVPTLNGEYAEASEAIFSAEWPSDTKGKQLQGFLDTAPTGLPDLERMRELLLAAPDHSAFRSRWIDDWVLFLTELGVNKGLTPELRDARNKTFPAYRLSNFSFVKDYGIPPEFADFWRKDIYEHDPSLFDLPYNTEYVIDGKLSWLPGQADINRFSGACKTMYAKLILDWLLLLSQDNNVPWDIIVHHQAYYQADRRSWPTPLKSFLRSACWLPINDSTRSTTETMVRPCDVWVNNTDSERFLPFLPRPSPDLRRYLERAPHELIQRLVKHSGLRILNDPVVLGKQLEFLARQYASESLDHYYEPHLLNLYNETWRLLSKHLDNVEHEFDHSAVPSVILVRKGHAFELVSMSDQDSDEGEHIYVCDTNREGDQYLLEASGQSFFFLRGGDPEKIGVLFENFYNQRIRRLSKVTYALRADGENIRDSVATPVLNICPQLRAMLAIAMEALSGTEAQRLPSDRTTILAKLERLTMMKAGRLSFVIDGMDVSTEQNTSGAFHFKLDDGRSIIAVQSSEEWTWELVDRSIPAICEALGHRALAPHLRLLVAHLLHGNPLQEAESRPFEDVEQFSGLLQLSSSASDAARASLSAGMERHAPWIRTILHLEAGPTAVEAFDEKSDDVLKDPDLLQTVLSRLLGDTSVCAEEVLAICRSALGPEDFRESLGLDFAEFNRSLKALGLDPVTYPDLHRSRLETFVREKEVEITDCLRAYSAKQLNKMQPAEGYAAKRDSLRALDPDPAWLPDFKEPPEEALIEHVNAWLAEIGAPSLGDCGDGLEPLALVRKHNQQFVHDFTQRAMPLVRAWCARFQPELPMTLLAAEGSTGEFRKQLDDIGVLDFRKLDNDATMRWLQILKIWPAGMGLSLDLGEVGLSEADLKTESMKAREENESRKKEARSISFNGRPVDPNNIGLLKLSEDIYNGLSPLVLQKTLGATPSLSIVEQMASIRHRSDDGRSGRGRKPRVPEEKTELIGRLGEFAVYHWLRKILPSQDIDAAWKSENRTPITGRKGNDGLGYDFEVSYRRQIWQIEVKASQNDPQSFELRETEVRAARIAARPRSGLQYKIAYVSNVSDLSKTNIEMLPNPMTEEGAHVLQLRGEGIRYSFSRNQS